MEEYKQQQREKILHKKRETTIKRKKRIITKELFIFLFTLVDESTQGDDGVLLPTKQNSKVLPQKCYPLLYY